MSGKAFVLFACLMTLGAAALTPQGDAERVLNALPQAPDASPLHPELIRMFAPHILQMAPEPEVRIYHVSAEMTYI